MFINKISLALGIAIVGLTNAQKMENLVKFVNPLIGTEKMGHTYPGATTPFGAVKLSIETDSISYELNGKYNREV